MNNRNRPDVIRILGYVMLGLLIAGFLAWRWGLIPSREASLEGVTVHGGLPDPMPEVERLQSVNDADVDLMVRTLSCEAPNEPVDGLIAVAWVIRTRVEQKGLTYEQVIKEPFQFSCFNSWIPLRLKRLRDTPQEALSPSHYATLKWIAQGVVSGELDNPLLGATHYYSSCLIAPPFWVSKFEFVGQVGCHRFYRGG